jgi:hypothetical protein
MDLHSLTCEVYRTGLKIREQTILRALQGSEPELTAWVRAAGEGDEQLGLDLQAPQVLEDSLTRFADANGCRIEIIGEAFPDRRVVGGSAGARPQYLVHVDVIDGTRESMHKVGLSYFEAGILPWSQDPRLAQTVEGIAITNGYDPLTGRLYSYHSSPTGSYRFQEKTKERSELVPTQAQEFNSRGFFNTITSFRGTGILAVLKDRLLEAVYGRVTEPDVFHRETLTSCGELVNLAKGGTRCVMDLRPAVAFVADKLGIGGYESKAGLCMHPYDVSGSWPILRDTRGAVLHFYDEQLRQLKAEDIRLRELDKDIGYIACGNETLFEKVRGALRQVLGPDVLR